MARVAKKVTKASTARAVTPKKAAPAKRGIGRPAANGNSVGREKLLKTACDLLKVTPPGKLTRFMVAQKAGVDPSLIRYYFRDRTSMLAAAAERLGEQYTEKLDASRKAAADAGHTDLAGQLATSVGVEINFAHFRRLLADELLGAGTGAAKAATTQIAKHGLQVYRDVLGGGDDEAAALLFIATVALASYAPVARSLYESATGKKISQPAMNDNYGEFVAGLLAHGVSAGVSAKPVAAKPAASSAKPKAGRGKAKS